MPPSAADRGFFARDTAVVARSLIGSILVAGEVRAEIVEVEAYLGEADPASHAFRGPTPRASIMFGPPGHLYVYLSYGMHCCANLVTEPAGVAGAVLLRAAAVVDGEGVVRARREAGLRSRPALDALLRGPGNLCRGLAIGLADNALDVCAPGSRVQVHPGAGVTSVGVGTRVGISRATDLPLRFWHPSHPAVSARRL